MYRGPFGAFPTNFLPEDNALPNARESFQSFPEFLPRGKTCTGFHLNRRCPVLQTTATFLLPGVEPLDPNVSSVPRTMVLAQGSQDSKGLPYLCIRGANYLSDLLCAQEEST